MAQQAKYSVSGTSADNGKKVYLIDKLTDKAIDSVVVANGKFAFSGTADQNAFMAVKAEGKGWMTVFFNDGTPVSININDSTLKGSPMNERLTKNDVEMDVPTGLSSLFNYKGKAYIYVHGKWATWDNIFYKEEPEILDSIDKFFRFLNHPRHYSESDLKRLDALNKSSLGRKMFEHLSGWTFKFYDCAPNSDTFIIRRQEPTYRCSFELTPNYSYNPTTQSKYIISYNYSFFCNSGYGPANDYSYICNVLVGKRMRTCFGWQPKG